jgi:hypothetical protein
MTDKGDDELGSRCIYCGEPFSAHKVDWCSSEEEAQQMTTTPVELSINDLKIIVIALRKAARQPDIVSREWALAYRLAKLIPPPFTAEEFE